jgi:hypothetical protein
VKEVWKKTLLKENQTYPIYPFFIDLPPKSLSKRTMWSTKSF